MPNHRLIRATLTAVMASLLLSSCASSCEPASGICGIFASFGDESSQTWKGVPATMRTYNQTGDQVDQIEGTSFRVSRDKKFDTSNSDESANDSSVLAIRLGGGRLSHVGSTMILAEKGLTEVKPPRSISFTNADPGRPWLNDLREARQDLWKGKSKTIMIRSRGGTPIGVYAGDAVEIRSTDVPESTWFRIDGKDLLLYRADYTVYDNDLLS